MTPNYKSLPARPISVCACSGCAQISPLGAQFDIQATSADVSLLESATACSVCPLTVKGNRCQECRNILTEETFQLPSSPYPAISRNSFSQSRLDMDEEYPMSPSTPLTPWCRGCAATSVGEACFVCAAIVTEDTFSFHPQPFTQGSVVIIGPVWYHVARKRMNKLRCKLHSSNGYKNYLDAPLPPIFMNFPKRSIVGLTSQGIAHEERDDSLIGRAKELLAARLITDEENRMLCIICALIVELWFHGRTVFESDIISPSFAERLEQKDRYDWSRLGLRSELEETSILGITKKLASMKYLTQEDEIVIEDFCVSIARKWVEFDDDTWSQYESRTESPVPSEICRLEYNSIWDAESQVSTVADDFMSPFHESRPRRPDNFSIQFDEIDALLDARKKLAYIHIFAADDETASRYHMDPEVARQMSFLTDMPSPQEPCFEVEMPKINFRTLTEVEWEMLRPNFDEERHRTYTRSSGRLFSFSDNTEIEEPSCIRAVAPGTNLLSLVKSSRQFQSFPRFSTAYGANQTLQNRLRWELSERAIFPRSQTPCAIVTQATVECRLVNTSGEAFEWSTPL